MLKLYRLASALTMLLMVGILFPVIARAADDGGVIPDDNIGRWSFLVGVVLPLVIAAVNRHNWSTQTKGLCAVAVSAVAALGTAYFAGELTGEDYVTSFLIVAVSAVSTHAWFWKPSGIANSVEAKTG